MPSPDAHTCYETSDCRLCRHDHHGYTRNPEGCSRLLVRYFALSRARFPCGRPTPGCDLCTHDPARLLAAMA